MFNVFSVKKINSIICFVYTLLFVTIPSLSIIQNNTILLVVNKTTSEDFFLIAAILIAIPFALFYIMLRIFNYLKLLRFYWIFLISLGLYWITTGNLNSAFKYIENLNILFIPLVCLILFLIIKKFKIYSAKSFFEFNIILLPLCIIYLFYQIYTIHSTYNIFNGESSNKAYETEKISSVVLIILDELSYHDFQSAGEKILPNIYKIKNNSFNFSKAYSAADTTYQSIPAMLTDAKISHLKLPFSNHYPENLFSTLSKSHKIFAHEPITLFCKNKICHGSSKINFKNLSIMLNDILLIFFNKYFPFPQISPTLGNKANHFFFGRWYSDEIDQRVTNIEKFTKKIVNKSSEKVFIFAHYLLPHSPYMYDHNCLGYSIPNNPDELGDGYEWKVTQKKLDVFYYRFLHQLKCADKMVGLLINKLKALNLYNESLIIITSDHGVSFKINENRRVPSQNNYNDIANVPLIIKLPNQNIPKEIDKHVSNGNIDDFILSGFDINKLKVDPNIYQFYSTKLIKLLTLDLEKIKIDNSNPIKTMSNISLLDFYKTKFKVSSSDSDCGVVKFKNQNLLNMHNQIPMKPCFEF